MTGKTMRITPLALLFAVAAGAAHAEDLAFDCLAVPAQRVAVCSPVTGLLARVEVGRGDEVKVGDVVARLDSKVEEANVALARAQSEATEALEAQRTRMALAEASLARSRKLAGSGNVTKSKIEELEATVEIARRDFDTEGRRLLLAGIELQRQQALLDRQNIRATVDGFVAEQSLRAGEFVRQDSPIMTIVQTDPLYVEAYVPVTLWGKIVLGTVGTVALEHPAGLRREAPVTVVDREFDAASGTFGVRLGLPNPGHGIPAGQRCKLTFPFDATAVATTP